MRRSIISSSTIITMIKPLILSLLLPSSCSSFSSFHPLPFSSLRQSSPAFISTAPTAHRTPPTSSSSSPLHAKPSYGPKETSHNNMHTHTSTIGEEIDLSDNIDPSSYYADHDKWVASQSNLFASQKKEFFALMDGMRDAVNMQQVEPSNSNHEGNEGGGEEDENIDIDLSSNPLLTTSFLTLLSKALPFLLSMRGTSGISIMKESMKFNQDKYSDDLTSSLCDFTITFLENFVETASETDSNNQHLLGGIIKAATTPRSEESNSSSTANTPLDEYLANNRNSLTTQSFLNHLTSEITRVTTSPTSTPQTAHLLEILTLIKARVIEEIGGAVGGDAALGLQQVLQVADDGERFDALVSVLDSKGLSFGIKMSSLIDEGLGGLKGLSGMKVKTGVVVDKELVRRLEGVGVVVKKWIEERSSGAEAEEGYRGENLDGFSVL